MYAIEGTSSGIRRHSDRNLFDANHPLNMSDSDTDDDFDISHQDLPESSSERESDSDTEVNQTSLPPILPMASFASPPF